MHIAVVAIGVVIVMRVRVDALVLGRLQDHGVEPFAQRHARPARRFFRRLAGFRPDPFHAPRHDEFHARTTLRSGDAKPPIGSPWNRHALTGGGYWRGPLV